MLEIAFDLEPARPGEAEAGGEIAFAGSPKSKLTRPIANAGVFVSVRTCWTAGFRKALPLKMVKPLKPPGLNCWAWL